MTRILKFLTDDEEARLLANSTRCEFGEGDVIVREGERSRCLFILRSGEARVERSHGEYALEVSRLGAGELFGEMGFVEDYDASASVVADGPCSVEVVEDAHVRALAESDPGFAGRFFHSIAELLSRRLRATSVQALSEFSWGTGSFTRPDETPEEADVSQGWGGGSPLRDELATLGTRCRAISRASSLREDGKRRGVSCVGEPRSLHQSTPKCLWLGNRKLSNKKSLAPVRCLTVVEEFAS